MSMKANALNLMTIYRGSIVSISYCLTCHGVNADGKGPRRKIVCPGACQPSRQPVQRYVQRNDRPWRREAHGALVIHAAWGEELTDEQIRDVIAYLKSILTVSPPAQSTRQ